MLPRSVLIVGPRLVHQARVAWSLPPSLATAYARAPSGWGGQSTTRRRPRKGLRPRDHTGRRTDAAAAAAVALEMNIARLARAKGAHAAMAAARIALLNALADVAAARARRAVPLAVDVHDLGRAKGPQAPLAITCDRTDSRRDPRSGAQGVGGGSARIGV